MGKYQAYPEYKDSGIDWLETIPEHWMTSKLRYAFSFGKGLTITKENLKDTGVPCVSYGEVHSKYGFEVNPLKHPLKCVDEDYIQSSPYALLKNGDIVFADTSEDIDGSGNFTQLVSDELVFAGYHTIIARPFDRECSRFYAYLLDSKELRTQIRHAVKGVKVFSITQAILRGVNIWLPPLEERAKIASFLDHATAKIDTLIDKQQQLIRLLKEKRQAVISYAVTKGVTPEEVPMKDSGVEWLGEVPEHWVVKPMNMASSKLAVGLATSVTNYYRESGAPIIRNLNIKQGYFDGSDMLYIDESFALKEKSKVTKYGDVLMVRTGSNIGLACTTPKEFDDCHTFTTLIITPNQELNAEYLTCCINSAYGKSEVQKLKQGFGKDNLNVEELRRFQVVVPPITEQNKIVSYLSEQNKKIDDLLIECNKAISLMQERRIALISAAVTGKIDVRNWQAPVNQEAQQQEAG